MTVSILGTEYSIVYKRACEDAFLESHNGYVDYSDKTIVLKSCSIDDKRTSSVSDISYIMDETRRHEIIHAFLFESGLSDYAYDETIVQWMAAQWEKINNTIVSFKAKSD